MASVEILDSCMVRPSEATPEHRLWLSNLDLVVPRSHTPAIYFYRPRPGLASFAPDVLKGALSKALVPYYPLAGRLAVDGGGRPEIHCSGDGVLFVTARVDAVLDDMGHPAPSDELRRMFVPSDDEHAGILTMVQVTFFKCGGVCLGTASHHMASDGRAFSSFLNTWAAIARGVSDAATSQPCLDRTLLRARSPPDVRFDHVEYERPAGCGGVSKPNAPIHTAILPVSRDQVNVLKAAIGAGDGGKKISTFIAVVAHVWRCACKTLRGTDNNTRVCITADGRSRICPPLPSNYLGNAIFRTSAVAKVDDIISGTLSTAAQSVSDATAQSSNEYMRSLVDHLEEQANNGMAGLSWAIPETDLNVTSWLGLSLSDVDFGSGGPKFFGRASSLANNGLIYLVPVPDSDGQLNIVVTMESERLSRFKKLFYEEFIHVASDMHVIKCSDH